MVFSRKTRVAAGMGKSRSVCRRQRVVQGGDRKEEMKLCVDQRSEAVFLTRLWRFDLIFEEFRPPIPRRRRRQ